MLVQDHSSSEYDKTFDIFIQNIYFLTIILNLTPF